MSDSNSNPYNVGDNPKYILLEPGASELSRHLQSTSSHLHNQLTEDATTDTHSLNASAEMVGGSKRRVRIRTNRRDAPKVIANILKNTIRHRESDFVFNVNKKTYKAHKKDNKIVNVNLFSLTGKY